MHFSVDVTEFENLNYESMYVFHRRNTIRSAHSSGEPKMASGLNGILFFLVSFISHYTLFFIYQFAYDIKNIGKGNHTTLKTDFKSFVYASE